MDNTSTLSSTQMQLKKDHLFYLYCVNGIFSLIYFILAISVSNKCFVSPCEEYGSPGFIQMFRVRSRYYMYIYNKTLLVFFLSYYIYIYIYILYLVLVCLGLDASLEWCLSYKAFLHSKRLGQITLLTWLLYNISVFIYNIIVYLRSDISASDVRLGALFLSNIVCIIMALQAALLWESQTSMVSHTYTHSPAQPSWSTNINFSINHSNLFFKTY